MLIDDAKAAGYDVTMTYIALDNVEDNLWRVDRRSVTEIRTVPAEDVRRRYERSLENVGAVADHLDLLVVFDNSGKRFEPVLRMERGRIVTVADTIPAWTKRAFTCILTLCARRLKTTADETSARAAAAHKSVARTIYYPDSASGPPQQGAR